ncbi:MAG: hypothetical protein AB1671_02315 [Thermodesulfobacteriota bacterium]
MRYRPFMPSEFGRGLQFGMGCALGAALIMTVFLLGLSMCAGEFRRRLLEEFKEQMRDMTPPAAPPLPERDRAASPHWHGSAGLPFAANSRSEYPRRGE